MKSLLIYTVFTLLIVIGIVSQSCEKEESKSEQFLLLTAHIWKHDTLFTICQDPEIRWFIHLLDSTMIVKGGTLEYNANGKFVFATGTGEEFESGNWKFSNEKEDEILTYEGTDTLGLVRIQELTTEVLETIDLIDVPPSDTCYVKARWVK